MTRTKRLLSMVLVAVFTLMICLSNAPVSAAVKKTTTKAPAVPKVRFVNQPQTEYTAGDMVKFDLDAKGYAGKVQYRVILWNDETKSYKDLWNVGDKYYTNWKPSGNTLFNLHWIINEPGHYRITILAKRADLPNSKTALKGQNCDSYIAGVPFVVKAKDTTVLLNKEGSTYGSADPKKPVSVKGDVKVVAKAVTYKNANVDGNLYISADNAILNNVNVTGTVFVDPGKDGNATLENVTAKEVKVLSGGENSIHLKSVNTDSLVVESDSKVRVESTGTTKVGKTEVTSYAILDSKGGSLGTITVTKSESGKVEVEFRGTFTEPIVVQTEATIKSAADANIAKVEIAPEKGEAVKLEGTFKTVEVTKEAKVAVAADAKITETLKVTAKAEIKADAKSEVAKVELAPSSKDETIKLEGTFNTVEITKEAKVELAAGTTVEEVQAKATSEIKLADDAKIEEVKNDAGVDTKTEGGTVVKETTTQPTTPTTPSTGGGGSSGGGDTTAPSITSFNGRAVTGTSISESFANLTKSSLIVVSENSDVTFSVAGLNTTFSGVKLNQGSNGVYSIPVDTLTSANIANIDFGALLNAAKNSNVTTRENLIKSIDFTALFNASINVSQTEKDAFYRILQTASNDTDIQAFKLAVAIALLPAKAEILEIVPATEKAKIESLLDGTNTNISGIDVTAIFNAIKSADNTTKKAIFDKVDFTSLITIVGSYNDATKNKVYGYLIQMIESLEGSNIRTQVLNAVHFDSIQRGYIFDLLNNIDGNTSNGVVITLTLKDSANNPRTYTITITQ